MGQYWDFLQSRRLRRRAFLGRTAAASAGVAGLALVGCGDDDDDDDDDATAEGTSEGTESTATSAPAGTEEEGGEEETATAAPAGEVKMGGTLMMMDFIASDVFDPAITIHAGSLYQGMVQTYDLINRTGKGFVLEPQMADLPEQVDELTLVYTFKPGINWHDRPPLDGRAFTAEDAVFGLERFSEPNPEFTFGGRFSLVDRYEAVDEKTLRVISKEPFSPLLANIAEDNMLMVAPEAAEQFGDDGLKLHENMIGTGAFMPDGFEQGVSARVIKNPAYWQTGLPYLDAIEVTQIADAAQREAAFISGQVDMNAGWGMLTSLSDVENWEAQLGDDMWSESKQLVGRVSCHFNTAREPFNDVRVRRALHLSADRVAIDAALGTKQNDLMGPVPQHVIPYGLTQAQLLELPGYRDDKDADITEAKALLAAAGLEDGFSFTLLGGSPAPANEVLQQNWKALNIDVTLTGVTIPEWITARANGDFDVTQTAITETADPDQALYGANHTDGTVNFGKFSDPEIDTLAARQRTIFDVDERKAVIDELQLKLLDLAPQIWTYSFTFQNVARSYVKGFTVVGGYQGWPFLETWLDKEA